MKTYAVLLASLFTLSACNIGNSHPWLMRKSCGGTMHYTQERQPGPEQIKNGLEALRKWKDATDVQRNLLADEIVLGRSLTGLSGPQVEQYLGKTETPNRYKTKGYEERCELVLEWDGGGRVSRAFIDSTN